MAKIDFSVVDDVAGGDFAPIPDGEYDMLVTDTNYYTSSTGNPTLKVTLTIADGQHKGRKIFESFSLSNKIGMGILKSLVCGAFRIVS